MTLLEDFPGSIDNERETDITPELPLTRNQRRIAKKVANKSTKGKSPFDLRNDLVKTHKSFGELIGTYVGTLKGLSAQNVDTVNEVIAPAVGALDVAATAFEKTSEVIAALRERGVADEDLYWEAFTAGNELVEEIQKLNEVVHPILDEAFELAEAHAADEGTVNE